MIKTPCYTHPTTILEFESVYREEYEYTLASCDRWIEWCRKQNPPDLYGVNFYQGRRGALIFNDIKMCHLLRVLKQEPPNAAQEQHKCQAYGDGEIGKEQI